MISYRQADLFRALQTANAECEVKAYVGRPDNISPFRAVFDLRTLTCSIPEVKGEVKNFLSRLLQSEAFHLNQDGQYSSGEMADKAGAESQYFDIFLALKNGDSVKDVSNTFVWVPGTKVKELTLKFTMR